MLTADWKAAGKQEAEGVLIRRLDFPVKELVYTPGSGRVEIRLGQPTTTQRDIQPLRRGQEVFIIVPARIAGTHTSSFAHILDVGEGVVTVRPTGLPKLATVGRSIGPDRMIRPEQYVASGG